MEQKYPIKLWSRDRLVKKTFFTLPLINEVVKIGHSVGISGSKIVLELDGTEICDDDSLKYYIQEKNIFMLLDYTESWNEPVDFAASLLNHSLVSDQQVQIQPTNSEVPVQQNYQEFIPPNNFLNHSDTELNTSNSPALLSIPSTGSDFILRFYNFIIPWQAFPAEITVMLQNKEYLGRKMACFGNLLIDELRQISYYIPMSVIELIAQKVALKYPDSFYFKDLNRVNIKTVPLSLINIMKNRNAFLNRPFNRARGHHRTLQQAKQRKRLLSNLSPGRACKTVVLKQKYLQKLFNRGNATSRYRVLIHKFMSDCFTTQRALYNDLISIPSAEQIKTDWPFIFEKPFAFQHFKQLMNMDVTNISVGFNQNKRKFDKFWGKCRIREFSDCTNNSVLDYDVIQSFFLYFNEDSTLLFKRFWKGTTFDEIQNACPTSTPWFAILEPPTEFENTINYMFFEKFMVTKFQNESMINLFCLAITYFYNFNVLYPKEIGQTLEFFSRYFLQNYSNNYTEAHINSSVSKIDNLITKLDNYDHDSN